MALLEITNLKKYFPLKSPPWAKEKNCVRAVDGVSLSVNAGENFSIVGESGSGKSTLARVVMKLIAADEGRLLFNGTDYTRLKGRKMAGLYRDIQMVFQDPYSSLDPRFSVRRILSEAFVLLKAEKPSGSEKEQRMARMLNAVGLSADVLPRYPHEFSGGERQRIAIARALMVQPKLLILDEAVSSLDVLIQAQILELLAKLQKDFHLTYLFISHNLKVVRKISQRVAVMYKGRIVELAPVAGLFENPLHEYTRELLSAAIEYKPVSRTEEISVPKKSQLIDKGNGHFVMM